MNDQTNQLQERRISVIDPLSKAIEWAREMLFRPFRLEKWLVLGFCAWLAGLAECGGPGGNSGARQQGNRREFERGLHQAWEWVQANWVPLLIVTAIIVAVCLALWLLVTWLSSRGKFMFLDGVVHNRAAVVEPWRRLRTRANSLFLFRLVYGLVGFGAVIAMLTLLGCLLWVRIGMRRPEPLLLAGVICLVLAMIAVAAAFTLIAMLLNDFVVPLMYLRDRGVVLAWGELGRLISARPGAFFLYVLVKIVISIVTVALVMLACCLTCCIVLLPYVGTVVLLPLAVFLRAYPLYFLGQFGPEFSRFATLGTTPSAP